MPGTARTALGPLSPAGPDAAFPGRPVPEVGARLGASAEAVIDALNPVMPGVGAGGTWDPGEIFPRPRYFAIAR